MPALPRVPLPPTFLPALLLPLLLLLLPFPTRAEEGLPNPSSDPSITVPPVATPTAAPSLPPALGPSCDDPGTSGVRTRDCKGVEREVYVKNSGRIDVHVYVVNVRGHAIYRYGLRPGEKRELTPTCDTMRWMVRSVCGQCMHVFEVDGDGVFEAFNELVEAECPGSVGEWDEVAPWPVIPVSLAHLPTQDGPRLLGFAAQQKDNFRGLEFLSEEENYTFAVVYNPMTGSFKKTDLVGHDVFCAALTTLPDGRVFTGGGGQGLNSRKVSTFDPVTMEWTRHADMLLGHWYGTAVLTDDDRVLLSLGVDRLTPLKWPREHDFPELSRRGFNFDKPWRNMTGIDYKDRHAALLHWYPFQHRMKNGKILHHGPQNAMYQISTRANNGRGKIEYVGLRNPEKDEGEAWGATSVYFEREQVLNLGGIENYYNDDSPNMTVFKRAIVIDFNDPYNITTYPTSDLHHERAFPNAVALPSGEVLVLGGKNNTMQWDDTYSVFNATIWNPRTGLWTLLAPQEYPRNYHSTAILLPDARVLSGGGGLCGHCNGVEELNHQNSQIFSPPYLFGNRGRLKKRPEILRVNTTGVPSNGSLAATIKLNKYFKVKVGGNGAHKIERVSMVKMYSVTHGISTDQRQIRIPHDRPRDLGKGKVKYRCILDGNRRLFTKGYWYLFVLNHHGTPSVAATVLIE